MINFPRITMAYRNDYALGYTVVCPYDEKLAEEIKSNGNRYFNLGDKLIVMRLTSDELKGLDLMGVVKSQSRVNDVFKDVLKSIFFYHASLKNDDDSGYCRLTSFIDSEEDLTYTKISDYDITLSNTMSLGHADEATKDGRSRLWNRANISKFGDPSCMWEYMNKFNKIKDIAL